MRNFLFFFFNDTATTEIYTLSLHDALPISLPPGALRRAGARRDLPAGPRVHGGDPRQRAASLLLPDRRLRLRGAAARRAAGLRLRGEVGVGHAGASAGDLPVPGARRAGAVPRDRAHGPGRLFRARLPRLVPREIGRAHV